MAYTSALGFTLTDGPLGEVLICSAGYALAISTAAWVVRRHTNGLVALLVAAVMLLVLGRIYKWYYWCFPVLVLWSFARSLGDGGGRARHAAGLGFLAGCAGLYRLDLGLACGALAAVAWTLAAFVLERRRLRRLPILLLAGCAPLLVWLAVLLVRSGASAVLDYVSFTIHGALSIVEAHQTSVPTPRFDWHQPFATSSQLALALWVVPAVSVLAVLLCAVRLRGRPADPRRLLVLGAAALGGLALLPQALHALEQQHLLQTLPFLPACVALLLYELREVPLTLRGVPLASRALSAACTLALLAMLVPLHGGFDLRPADNPLRKFRLLVNGPPANSSETLLRVIATLEALVPPGESVLVLPRPGKTHPTQLYAWIHRPMAGIFNVYFPGLFEDDEWRLRNYRAVLAHPPAAVIAERSILRASRPGARLGHAELFEYVRSNYGEVAFDEQGWLILRPSGR